MNYNTGAPLTLTAPVSRPSATQRSAAAQPNIVGALPKDMGKITKVSNGVVYFDGFTQITDPGHCRRHDAERLEHGLQQQSDRRSERQDRSGESSAGRSRNAGSRDVKGPTSLGLDMNMIKRFKLHGETTNFEFRLDAINILNHPNFGNPDHEHQRATIHSAASPRRPDRGASWSTRASTSNRGSDEQADSSECHKARLSPV